MVEPLRHRQTKGAATRMPDLTPPRHIPTLLCDFPIVGPPAHPLGLPAITIQDARLPAKPLSDPVRLPRGAVPCILPRAVVGEPMAMPAGEDGAAIEESDAAPAANRRTQEPWAGATQAAACAADVDGVLLVLPLAAVKAMPVAQNDATFLGPDPYFDDLYCLAADRRFLSCERIVDTAELTKEASFHALKINRLMVDGVVETPNGAHFTSCVPDYDRDERFQREYAKAAADPEAWTAFRERFLAGDEAAYQQAVSDFAGEQA